MTGITATVLLPYNRRPTPFDGNSITEGGGLGV